MTEEFLSKYGIEEEKIERIYSAIRHHSMKKGLEMAKEETRHKIGTRIY